MSYGQSVCWMDSTKDEISVWSRVMQSCNSWVDTCLPIRTNLQLCSDWTLFNLWIFTNDIGCKTVWVKTGMHCTAILLIFDPICSLDELTQPKVGASLQILGTQNWQIPLCGVHNRLSF